MFTETMRAYLEAYLKAHGADKTAPLRWNALWDKARETSMPAPCPSCFLDGRITGVISMLDEGGKTGAYCKVCKNTFAWPSSGIHTNKAKP